MASSDTGIRVNYRPSPFSAETERFTHPGGSITEIALAAIDRAAPAGPLKAFLDGREVPIEFWDRTKPKAGHLLELAGCPAGGGNAGKDGRMRAVLSMLTSAGAMILGGLLFGSPWGQVFSVAVSLGGILLWNALIPARNEALSESHSLSGTGNAIEPYGVVPFVVGKAQITPRLAARPYTSVEGDNQYLHLLFCLGLGKMRLHEARIGSTLIQDVSGVSFKTFKSGSAAGESVFRNDVHETTVAAEIPGPVTALCDGGTDTLDVGAPIDDTQGFEDQGVVCVRDTLADEQPSFVDPDTYTVNALAGTIVLDSGNLGSGDARWEVTYFPASRYVQRTAASAAESLNVDIVFAEGLFREDENGDDSKATVHFDMRYRITGMVSWIPFIRYVDLQADEWFRGGTMSFSLSRSPIEGVQRIRDDIGVDWTTNIALYGTPFDLDVDDYVVDLESGEITRADAQNWAEPEYLYKQVTYEPKFWPAAGPISLNNVPMKPGTLPTIQYVKLDLWIPPLPATWHWQTILPGLYETIHSTGKIWYGSEAVPLFWPVPYFQLSNTPITGYRVSYYGRDPLGARRDRWRVVYTWNPLSDLAESLDEAAALVHIEECATVLNEVVAAVKLVAEVDRTILSAYRTRLYALMDRATARLPGIDATGADPMLQALIDSILDVNGNSGGIGELRVLMADYGTVVDPEDSDIAAENDMTGMVLSILDALVDIYVWNRDRDGDPIQGIYQDVQRFGHLQAWDGWLGRFGTGPGDVEFSFSDTNTGTVRKNLSWSVTPAEYEVSIRRNSIPDGDPSPMGDYDYSDTATWSVLRAEGVVQSVVLEDVNLLGMKIRASETLSGSLDDVTAVVQQLVPVWDSDLHVWTETYSRNPAWYFLSVLLGPHNKALVQAAYPVWSGGWVRDRIDMESIVEWAAVCDEKEWWVDIAFETAGTVLETLKRIAAAGRASISLVDGRYGVVIDRDMTSAGPVQLFTPRNVSGFRVIRAFIDNPHALKVQFLNAAARYQEDEVIVYDDEHNLDGTPQPYIEECDGGAAALTLLWGPISPAGLASVVDTVTSNVVDPGLYTVDESAGTITLNSGTWAAGEDRFRVTYTALRAEATQFETVTADGITDVERAWKYGRYLLAAARLRPRKFSFITDWEYLRCRRGDLVQVQHYVPLVGLYSGARVISVVLADPEDPDSDIVGVVIDDLWTIAGGTDYSITVRYSTGAIELIAVDTSETGETDTIMFQAAAPEPDGQRILPGDLCSFGEAGLETLDLIVSEIQPGASLSATMVCVDHSPAVHIAEEHPIPDFDPGITEPPVYALDRPPAPVVDGVVSDESVLTIVENRFVANIVSSIAAPPENLGDTQAPAFLQFEWRRFSSDGTGAWNREADLPLDTRKVWLRNVTQGASYDLRFRWRTARHRLSEWTPVWEHNVIGQSTRPPDPTNFRITNSVLTWDMSSYPVDLAGFVVKSIPGDIGSEDAWRNGTQMHGGTLTVTTLDIGAIQTGYRTIVVKAVDAAGNESENAARIYMDSGAAETGNILVVQEESPGWAGVIATGEINDGGDLSGVESGTEPFWATDGDTTFWLDESLPFWAFRYSGVVYLWSFTTPSNCDDAALIIQVAATIPFNGAMLLYRVNGSIMDEFNGTLSVESETEYVFAMIVAAADDSGLFWDCPTVQQITTILDVPDIEERFEDLEITVAADGLRIPLTKAFQEVRHVLLTLQDTGTNAVGMRVVDKSVPPDENGPLVKAFDDAGSPATAIFDAVVIGY